MTLVVTHPFVSPKPQGGDSTRVYGPQWNANHTIAGTADGTQLNANVVQAVVNDTNIQGSISAQTLTFSWGGTLAAARLNANVVQGITNDTNVTGTIAAQNLTLGWTGQLGLSRGGTNADLSATGGTHQVLKQSSSGAAVTVGQLAFTDISGSVAATQLPNPTASTLGGIESYVGVSHQWINSISTSGVPSSTQPAFTDISGSVPNSQLATMAAWTFKANNTSGSATPTDITIDGLTLKASPAAADEVIIWDVAGAALKKATVSGVGASAGVSSLNTKTGAISLSVVKQVFTASGTYTPTANMVYCIIECVGAGGGGGGVSSSATSSQGGGGGGAGSYARLIASAATIGASKAVTIGTAGTAGASGGSNGGTGGDTSVGVLCVGKGGSGGQGVAATGPSAGGAGGVAGTGDFTPTGARGHPGLGPNSGSLLLVSGQGADGAYGTGGAAVSSATTAVGNAGTGFGAGGSGAYSFNSGGSSAGGAGAAGVVFITEYVVG